MIYYDLLQLDSGTHVLYLGFTSTLLWLYFGFTTASLLLYYCFTTDLLQLVSETHVYSPGTDASERECVSQ